MAQEMLEKRRSSTSTPRATQPVLARMLPRSINRTAANKKITLSPQFRLKFPDFSTVAHENHGIKGKRRKSVVVLTAPITDVGAARTSHYANTADDILRPASNAREPQDDTLTRSALFDRC